MKPGTQEWGTKCGECGKCSLGFQGMFTFQHYGECSRRFQGMFQKIPANVLKDSGESSRRFWGMFQKIPENVIKDSGECSERFRGMCKKIPRNLSFDLFLEIFLVFYQKNMFFTVKLLQNNGKKQLLSNSSKENIFLTTTYN